MSEPTIGGRFVWHELMTTEVKPAIAYYQKVVGWKTQAWEKDSSYLMWLAKSGPIGGVTAASGGAAPHWLHYISTPDIEATVKHTEKLGGKIVVPITAIPTMGSYAVLADPQGATFGVYGSASNAAPAGAPQLGEFHWQELATSDYQAAFAFYQALFGWQKTDQLDMGELGIYFMFGLNGQSMGGMYNKSANMPIGWCGYAQVADARKVAKVAAKAGGKIINGPMQVPGGSWIVQIIDPQGVMHAVVSSAAMAAPTQPAAKSAASSAVAVKKASKKKAAKKKLAKKKAVAKSKPAAVRKSVKKAAKKAVKKKLSPKTLAKKVSKKTARKPAPKKKTAKRKLALKKLKRVTKTKVAKKKKAMPKRRVVAKRKK